MSLKTEFPVFLVMLGINKGSLLKFVNQAGSLKKKKNHCYDNNKQVLLFLLSKSFLTVNRF